MAERIPRTEIRNKINSAYKKAHEVLNRAANSDGEIGGYRPTVVDYADNWDKPQEWCLGIGGTKSTLHRSHDISQLASLVAEIAEETDSRLTGPKEPGTFRDLNDSAEKVNHVEYLLYPKGFNLE